MFSGIVAGTFAVVAATRHNSLLKLSVALSEELCRGLMIGASVAIDGVCLTVTEITKTVVSFDVIGETLARTHLGTLAPGQKVNVERSLCYGMEVGGHLVEGHVLGCGKVAALEKKEGEVIIGVEYMADWTKYLFYKNYIAINGVSLTIADFQPAKCLVFVHLIPETLSRTNLGQLTVGTFVNIEIDAQQRSIVDTVERFLTMSASKYVV